MTFGAFIILMSLLLLVISFITGLILPMFFKRDKRKSRIVKRLRLIFILSPVVMFLLAIIGIYMFFGVFNSRQIVRVEVGSLPDKLVYSVGESDTIDLTGGTILVFTRGITYGVIAESGRYVNGWRMYDVDPESGSNVSEVPMYIESPHRIIYDIDFSTPGDYEIIIMWLTTEVGRIPIQVTERENDEDKNNIITEENRLIPDDAWEEWLEQRRINNIEHIIRVGGTMTPPDEQFRVLTDFIESMGTEIIERHNVEEGLN